jgi:DNA polymerase
MKPVDDSLEKIRDEVLICPKCRLALGRTHAVPGEGARDSGFMFVGEAPGRREDELGRPFVGMGGKFLDELLAKHEIDRKKVFISSVNKCRPPRNRRPKLDEIESCIPYLWRQIALVNPTLVVLLGDVAFKNVLGLRQSLSGLRGNIVFWEGREIIPTYHPNAALRFPKARELMNQDFALAVEELRRMGMWEKISTKNAKSKMQKSK